MISRKNYIGGNFFLDLNEIEKNNNKKNLFKNYSKENWCLSGRLSFLNILNFFKKKKIRTIYLPSYLCDSLIEPVKKLSFNIKFYNVDYCLNINDEFDKNSLILVIHYFGKEHSNFEEIRKNLKKNSYIIEDLSHVFLNKNCFFRKKNSIYFLTLRKHFNLLLGGFSHIKLLQNNNHKNEIDEIFYECFHASFVKKFYLNSSITNLNFMEKYYLSKFEKYEKFISRNFTNFYFNKFIYNYIQKINLKSIYDKRKKNWNYLDNFLNGKFPKVFDSYNYDEVPLGYMIKVKNRDKFREKLKRNGIFTSIHWKLPKLISIKKYPESYRLSNEILTIPIDQRYDFKNMEYLAKKIIKLY